MTALQASIGTLNDLVDAPRDAGHKPGKPIPARTRPGRCGSGSWSSRSAGVGLGLSVPSGVWTVALAARRPRDRLRLRPRLQGDRVVMAAVRRRDTAAPRLGWYGAVGIAPEVVRGPAPGGGDRRGGPRDRQCEGRHGTRRRGRRRLGRDSARVGASVADPGSHAGPRRRGGDHHLGRRRRRSGMAARRPRGRPRRSRPGSSSGESATSARLERAWELEAVGCGLLAAAWLAALGVGP